MIGRRHRLEGAAGAGFMAGHYWALREYWIGEARRGAKGSALRMARVGFAKSAHQAYLKELNRALHLQHREMIALAFEEEAA